MQNSINTFSNLVTFQNVFIKDVALFLYIFQTHFTFFIFLIFSHWVIRYVYLRMSYKILKVMFG